MLYKTFFWGNQASRKTDKNLQVEENEKAWKKLSQKTFFFQHQSPRIHLWKALSRNTINSWHYCFGFGRKARSYYFGWHFVENLKNRDLEWCEILSTQLLNYPSIWKAFFNGSYLDGCYNFKTNQGLEDGFCSLSFFRDLY